MKKLIALLLLLPSAVFAQQTATTTTPMLDPNQIYTTGNVVQMTTTTSGSTWVNGVYQDQLTCWAWGNPGNCGPNPTVRPGNYINYSFGYTDLYQVQAIASILPQTGLRVNGYTFGFTAKNGNGWDDGRLDQLNAYVAFYGTDGKVKDYTNYNLNSQFNWTTFSYSKDFVTPYADKDLSTVQYGFTGKDNNFWAGTYGPEIMNVNFSLKYSVDACAVNVLSSPTCPGYTEALLKSLPVAPTTVVDPVTTSTTSAGATTTTAIITDPVAPTVTTTSTTTVRQPSVVASVVSAPAPVTTSSPNTTTSSSSSSNSSSTTQSTKESTQSGGGNVSLALSVISKNSERDAAGSAVAQSAIAQAQQAANQAQQEAQSVASSAVSNSLTANAATTNNQQSSGNGIKVNSNSNSTNFTLQPGLTSVAAVSFGPQPMNSVMVQQQSNGTGINVTNSQPVIVSSVNSQQPNTTSFVLPLLQPQQQTFMAPVASSTQSEQQQQPQTSTQPTNTNIQSETYALVPPSFLTDKSNPMNDIIEGKQVLPLSSNVTFTGSVVNKNAGDNDIAGGVSINKMALAPTGYGDYLTLAMRDAAFYAPKEVYRNQRNVDNARALRQMTSDSKHKEMVEMQYAK